MAVISSTGVSVPVTVQGHTILDPNHAFDIIVPIDLSLVFKSWGGIFPGVRGVNDHSGAWDHVDAPRNPDLSDGSTAVETLVEYTKGPRFAYELVGFANILGHLVFGVRGEWTFTPDGSGTLMRWTYELKPRPVVTSWSADSWARSGVTT